MFEITDKALEMVLELTKDRGEIPAVRVVMESAGCSGPILGLAVEEEKENDEVLEAGGLRFVIDKDFFERIKPVKVDYIETERGSGFDISSSIPKSEDEGPSCGGGCSGCG